VSWIEKNFFIPETRQDPELRGRLRLQPYQRDALTEALSRDENGMYKYSLIVWSDIKKSIKSCIAAAVNLYRAEFTDWGEFYVVANDLKQANSRVSHYIRRAIVLNPVLAKKYKKLGYTITSPSGSVIEAIPIDPSGEAGSNADQITFSELWGANEEAKKNMWAEMTLSPTKHGKSFRWIESYAGWAEEAELLYSLYELGVKNGRLLWPDRLYDVTGSSPEPLELYVNDTARMLCLWNTVPRCPWQSPEYYASEATTLTPNQFERMHRNKWVSSSDTFIPMPWWFACERSPDEWPTIDKQRHPVIVSLDAATTNDCFGLLMLGRHPNKKDELVILYSQKWSAGFAGKIDFQGTEEHPGPERVLRKLIAEYNVIQVAYDPHQLHDMATRLNREHLAWFHEFSQGDDRLIADAQLRDLIRDKRIWYRGEVDLTEHLQNSNATEDPQERKIRIIKRTERLKIDLAICLSMASHEALRLNL
jgi:phage terminase large subunit-like protein